MTNIHNARVCLKVKHDFLATAVTLVSFPCNRYWSHHASEEALGDNTNNSPWETRDDLQDTTFKAINDQSLLI